MAEKDFKVKNGLFVTDSANVGSLRIRGDGVVVGDLTVQGTLTGSYEGFDSDFFSKTTDSLAEGENNLYYTTARADSDAKRAFTGGSNITVNSTTGVISLDSALDGAIDYMTFRPKDPEPAWSEGRLFYHGEYKALTFYNDDSDVALQIGQEEWVRVYNNSGLPITAGTPVYITGAFDESPTVAPGDATTEAKARILGLAAHTIENSTYGYVAVRGLVSGINTSTLTAGQQVHVNASGALQNAAPTYPYFPTEVGTCIVSDATNGYIYVTMQEHTFEQFRVSGNTHMDGNLTIDGDLTVSGTQSIVNQANLAIDDAFIYLNSGDTIGSANTNFTGTGLDDAYFTGHYEGTQTAKTFYVRIDGVGTGTGGVDTFEWSTDNFSSTQATGVDITGANQTLGDGISVFFNATTGHTSGDTWDGTASPLNVDTGWFTNYNTGDSGVGYTHAGIFFDATDYKFKVVEKYRPEPEGNIVLNDSSYGTIKASVFEGVATSANKLDSARSIAITGDVIADSASFDGTTNISLSVVLDSGVVTDSNISPFAAIVDTKLDTISTAGKVANSATTATDSSSTLTIVSRDSSGNFTANLITADFDRSANTTVAAGVYGSASLVPVLTIDSSGFIDSAGTVSVAGVSSVSFDSNSFVYTINTADGDSTREMIHSRFALTPGAFGSASLIPVVTVDSFGHVDSIGTTPVAGVSSVSFDSSSFIYTINTADGDSTREMIHTRFAQTPGAFGSASQVPVVTVDSFGHVDSIGTVSVAGVSSVSFDSASFVYKINTADGDSYPMMLHTRFAQTPGVFGSSSLVPIITVDSYGHVDSIGTALVAGVDSASWDSASSKFTINTADGNSYTTLINSFNQLYVNNQLIDSAWVTARADQDYIRNIVDSNYIYTAVDSSYIQTAVTETLVRGFADSSYIQTVFDDKFVVSSTGVTVTGEVVADSGTFTKLTRTATVDSATYGSAAAIPVITVNSSGFIDSIGTVTVDIPASYTDTNVDSHVSGGVGISYTTGEISVDSAGFLTYIAPSIDHNELTNWDSNKHIDHSSISIIAGVGLSGGGTLVQSRTLNLDSAQLNNYFGGEGKGFDADLLDGQEGTYYRIDVYDASGTLLN